MSGSQYRVLLIAHTASEGTGTVRDHVRALQHGLDADVLKADCDLAQYLDLTAFDVVILHYSLVIASTNYISDRLAEKLSAFTGLCILFIQDEYRWVDKTAESIRDLSVDVVFSVSAPDVVRRIYHHPWFDRVRFEHTLTGFVPDELVRARVPRYEDRPIDVGYRARKLPPWFGRHTDQKWLIAERFLEDAARFKLKVDIATDEASRIYGNRWPRFLMCCRAALGTESGASVCDFTGEIQEKMTRHLAEHPDASADELRALYLGDTDGRIVVNAISPRCFEAAALRTLLIMYPGAYNGILVPGRHYVELRPDHGNIDEVVAILRSPEMAGKIVRTAYEEIALSGRWSHKSLVEHVNRVIREAAGKPSARAFSRRESAAVAIAGRLTFLRHQTMFLLLPQARRAVSFVRRVLDKMPDPMQRTVRPPLQAAARRAKAFAKRVLRYP